MSNSWFDGCLLSLFNTLYEVMELYPSQYVVSQWIYWYSGKESYPITEHNSSRTTWVLFAFVNIHVLKIGCHTFVASIRDNFLVPQILWLLFMHENGLNLLFSNFLPEEERNGPYTASFHKTDTDVTPIVKYPDNLHIKDLLYFLCAPTLCYELNFPRTNRIRKRFLLKRILEVAIGFNVVLGLFQQWMIPSVRNSLVPFSNMDVVKATERLLKLAVSLIYLIHLKFVVHTQTHDNHFSDSKSFCVAVLFLFIVSLIFESNRRIAPFCWSKLLQRLVERR